MPTSRAEGRKFKERFGFLEQGVSLFRRSNGIFAGEFILYGQNNHSILFIQNIVVITTYHVHDIYNSLHVVVLLGSCASWHDCNHEGLAFISWVDDHKD